MDAYKTGFFQSTWSALKALQRKQLQGGWKIK